MTVTCTVRPPTALTSSRRRTSRITSECRAPAPTVRDVTRTCCSTHQQSNGTILIAIGHTVLCRECRSTLSSRSNESDVKVTTCDVICSSAVALLVGQRTCDSQVAGSSFGWAPLRSGPGQATYTCVPLSPSSRI